jgi:hypothetical protein
MGEIRWISPFQGTGRGGFLPLRPGCRVSAVKLAGAKSRPYLPGSA